MNVKKRQMQPRFFNNCRGRDYLHHYRDKTAFFDLNRFGLQDSMARDLEPGDECIVATQNKTRDTVEFVWYSLVREKNQHDRDGLPVRVQYGKRLRSKKMSKTEASKTEPFRTFFRSNGHFRRQSVIAPEL